MMFYVTAADGATAGARQTGRPRHHQAGRRPAHRHRGGRRQDLDPRVTVDNTAPVVTNSTPAEGQRLTSTVALTVDVKDDSGVAGTPVITLDGTAVKEGDEIGHGLPAGSHTLAVTATDVLGNTAVRKINFTSAYIPSVPTSLSSDVAEGSAVLSAALDGPATATFTAADVVLPTGGYQGVSAAVPTTLDVAHDATVDVTRCARSTARPSTRRPGGTWCSSATTWPWAARPRRRRCAGRARSIPLEWPPCGCGTRPPASGSC